MKILMIAPEPIFEPRGTPISVRQRLEMLSRLGHHVDLVTYHIGADLTINGVETHRIPNVPWIKEVKIGPSFAKAFLDIIIFFKAIAMLLRNQYDVIHSHEEASFFCPLLSAVFATPHIYDMHSNLPQQLRNSRFGHLWPTVRLFELLERWVLTTSAAVITIGSDLQERVRQISPQTPQFLIENLPTASYAPDDSIYTVDELKRSLQINGSSPVVYTGSFEPYQGLGLLLEAASVIKQLKDDVVFVMVGGKPDQVLYWQCEAQKMGLQDLFRFIGIVPIGHVGTYLEMAEVLVSPRISGTSIPLKIYDYLQSGKPILATNIDAHSEVLSPETALLVDASATAFAEGVQRLVRSPELRKNMTAQVKKLVAEKFDPAAQTAKLDLAYKAIQKGRTAPAKASYLK